MKTKTNPDTKFHFNLYLLPLRLRVKYPKLFTEEQGEFMCTLSIPLRIRKRLKMS